MSSYNYCCFSRVYYEPIEEGSKFDKRCERKCEFCNEKGNLTFSEKDEYVCPHTNQSLKFLGENVLGIIGPKMTIDQIESDRKKRSKDHFKKEIFPTMDKTGKKHHIKKDPGIKKYL